MGRPVKKQYSAFCSSLQRMMIAVENDDRQTIEFKLKFSGQIAEAMKMLHEANAREMDEEAQAARKIYEGNKKSAARGNR